MLTRLWWLCVASVIVAHAALRVGQKVTLKVPSGESKWLVAETCSIARLFVTDAKFRASALKLVAQDPLLAYGASETATIQDIVDGSDCVYVSVLPSGPDGWVHTSLAELTAAERRKNASLAAEASKRAEEAQRARLEREKLDLARPLQLIEERGMYTEFATTITGRIRNNTEKTYSYVQVVYNLYDAEGNQVGSAMANVNNLAPATVWRFKAVSMVRAVRFKVSGITGF